MSHTALHFAVGLVAGMAVTAPAVVRALAASPVKTAHSASSPHPKPERFLLGGARTPSAPGLSTEAPEPFTRMVAWSWGLGGVAIVPNLLRALGLPEAFCDGWWMNVFLFHQLLDRRLPGGTLIGGLLLVGAVTLQYALIVLAIALSRRRMHSPTPPAGVVG